jgi:hypothetical protein
MLRLGITAATVVYLAFAVQGMLSDVVSPHNGESATYTIEIVDRPGVNGTDPGRQLYGLALVADGRTVRWNLAKLSGGWESPSLGTDPKFLHKKNDEPSIVEFQARRFVAIFQPNLWSGLMRVRRNGQTLKVQEVRGVGWPHQVAISDGSPNSFWPLFLAAILAFGACAWWFGPVRQGRGFTPWLIFAVTVPHLLYWLTHPVGTNPDSRGYADSFLYFWQRGIPVSFPPGYSMLLGPLHVLAPDSAGLWVTGLQHVMLVLSVVWLFRILCRLMLPEIAFLASLVAGLISPSFTVQQAILSEAPTLFAITGALYFAIRASETEGARNAILAGLFTVWATLLRMVPIVAILPAFLLWYGSLWYGSLWYGSLWYGRGTGEGSPWKIGSTGKLALRAAATTAVTIGVCFSLVFLWTWQSSNQVRLSNSAGMHLFNRVFPEQKLVNENGPATKRLISLLGGKDPRSLYHWEVSSLPQFQALGVDETERILRQASMESILNAPRIFAEYGLNLFWRSLIVPTDWIPPWADTTYVNPIYENSPLLPFAAGAEDWRENQEEWNRIFWPLFVWASLAGFAAGLFTRHWVLVLIMGWIPTGYLLVTTCAEVFCPRYNAPVTHFTIALAILPLDLIVRKVWEQLPSESDAGRETALREISLPVAEA